MAKAMKAMKAMAAMKAMKAMKKKPISAKLAKRHAFFGKIDKTATGLKKSDLVKSKSGKIVSKKKSLFGKKSPSRRKTEEVSSSRCGDFHVCRAPESIKWADKN